MKLFVRKLFTFFSAIAMLLGAGTVANAATIPATLHIKVHYNRDAGDYAGYNLYLWKNMITGTDASVSANPDFATAPTDSYGPYVTADITGMTGYDNLGFIVRYSSTPGAWTAKDVTADRFMTNWDSSGNIEIWLKQGDPTIYTTAPVVTPPSPQIVSASFDDLRVINVRLNQAADLSALVNGGFTLSGGLEVASVQVTNGTTSAAKAVKITTTTDIPFGQSITLTQTGSDAAHSFGTKAVNVGLVMNSDGFNQAFTYEGDDLGATYTSGSTSFRVWAPLASAVSLQTWNASNLTNAGRTTTTMTQDVNGTWVVTLDGDQSGIVYMYSVTRNGQTVSVIDPYAHAVTMNGERGVVVDLRATDPTGFRNEVKPAFSGKNVDAIIYELQVRDFSMDSSSGIPAAHKGKYLAFTDNGTKYTWKQTTTDAKTKKKVTKTYSTATGVDAIKQLGVTHVELLPVYDFASGGSENAPTFNWGYDPQNYNVPEGGFSTQPGNPTARINELKQAIANLHAQGLRVNMDVVYNHVADAGSFSMEEITPGYFFRRDPASGDLLNGTGCGNETASERSMVRKFIVDSVVYWASEYHFDGFRFDLMGILDVTTMNEIRAKLNDIDSSIIMLGEGWNMGGLADNQKADQVNIQQMPGIAAFNDQIRDGIKGSVFNSGDTGWATGNGTRLADVLSGITGQTDYNPAVVSPIWTTLSPNQSVNYVEAHDNLTLADKIFASYSDSAAANSRANRFVASILYLAQGMPFQQAGQEFERSKGGNDNSYNASDSVNSIKYKLRVTHSATLNYYKGLISLRKQHPAFRMDTTAKLQSNLVISSKTPTYIGYRINGAGVGDTWSQIYVGHNAGTKARTVTLPAKSTWYVVVNDTAAGTYPLKVLKNTNSVSVAAGSTVVLYHN